MARLRPRKPSASMIVALVALMVALGGTSYAAITLPKNSVGSKQLKKNAVTTAKIKNGAVTAKKINPKGLSARAIAYAHIEANGTLDASHSKHVSASSLSTATTGVYCLKVSVPVVNVTATADIESSGQFSVVSAILAGQDPHNYIGAACPAGDNVLVGEMDSSGLNVDRGFWVSFN